VSPTAPESGTLPVGVIGVGHLGTYHLNKYAGHDLVSEIFLYDPEPGRAARQAEQLETDCRVAVCESLTECLEQSAAVSIAAPTSEHFDLGWMAINSGCHALIEKPITARPDEAWSLVEAADAAGLVLHVGHVERFNPALQGLNTSELNPKFIEAHRLAAYNPRGTDVPVVHDLMVHDLDLILYLVGEEPSDFQATGVPVITNTADIANVRLSFPGGCVANVTASRVSLAPMRKLRIFQRDAYLSLDLQKGSRDLVRLRDPDEEHGPDESPVLQMEGRVVTRSPFSGERDALAVEVDAFLRTVEAVRSQADTALSSPGVSGREAATALALAEEINRAITPT
jgi:predicted dehydrogenase